MQIQQKDYYHGAALLQIVEHESFTALNKLDGKYGHYKINGDIRLLIKKTANKVSPWQFTVNSSDLNTIKEDIESGEKSFLCLICGLNTICLLNKEQIQELLDLASSNQQWLRVKNTGSLWAWSAKAELNHAIPHNAFPDRLFND